MKIKMPGTSILNFTKRIFAERTRICKIKKQIKNDGNERAEKQEGQHVSRKAS
jgi:hypothetical protein